MAIGDCERVSTGECTDLYYVDTGMYGIAGYGSVYILDAERPAIVDTGTGATVDRILAGLETAGVDPADVAVVAPTHVHLDHAGGAGRLLEACPNAEVVVHENGARHLVDPERLVEGTKAVVGEMWEYYAEPVPVPEDRLTELEEGDVVDLGDHALEVYHAPGHAPHQAVFLDPANDALFAADAAGIYVPERDEVRESTPPPNFDLEGALEDVETQQRLDPGTLLYGHFGPAPADDRLAEYADVLSEWVTEVAEVRADLGDDDAVVEHFVERTPMAPVWGEQKARTETAMNVRGVLVYLDRREE